MFKKKSLKFTYERVSRDLRHAEAFKARESSRFERLSMIRSIDSDFVEKTMETPKKTEFKAAESKKPSRLEMLFKWKQEKQIKKEMEKLARKKPFYVGGKKNVIDETSQSFKSSFTGQPNSSINSSKLVKSKLVTPTSATQPSRILNSKQGIPNSTIQPSKVINSKQGTVTQSSRNVISKQGVLSAASQSSRIPNSKQITSSLPKSGTNLYRSNSTATLSRKFPVSSVDKASTLSKPASSLSRTNSTATISRKFQIPSLGINRAVPSKAPTNTQKVSTVNKALNNVSNSANAKSKVLSKPVNKVLLEQKSVPKYQEDKPVKKVGTSLPKVTSNITAVSKGISVQNKMPASNMNKKFGPNPKLIQKETSQSKENNSLRKGYCFKTAIANSSRQQSSNLLKTPMQGTPKKLPGKTSKDVREVALRQELAVQIVDSIPDVTFNSDISMIKPARTSFAPANFIFQPPEGLNNFIDDDDDYDVFENLREFNLKFMSRTSTPSKDSVRTSSIGNSKESLGSNNPMADIEKTSDVSNSNDIRISELMSPESYCVKTNNEESCDIIKNTEDVDIGVNRQTCPQEAEIITNQDTCKKLTSISPVKTEIEAIGTTNQQINEEKISDTNEKLNNTETTEKTVDNEIQKCLFDEKQSLNSSEIIVNQQTCVEDIKVVANQDICEKLISTSPMKTEIEAIETTNQEICTEISSDKNEGLNKAKTTQSKITNEVQKCLFGENQPSEDFDKVENQYGSIVELNSNENRFNKSLKNAIIDQAVEDVFGNDDSLLDSIDLNKIELMKLDDEDTDEDDVPSPHILKCPERKSNGALPKRMSILKKVSVMNSIFETDECVSINLTKSSKKSQDASSTPRRSKRISNHLPLEKINCSPIKNNVDNTNSTPRRSLRLLKISNTNTSNNFPQSPLQETNRRKSNPRHSVRLIDLSTPEKTACEKILEKNLENLDPNDFLIDFESPTMPAFPKNKKVSLLYSPEKRKSMRKSIRGDLISFSPV